MAKLSKDKVKAMLAKDMIVVSCDNAPELCKIFFAIPISLIPSVK